MRFRRSESQLLTLLDPAQGNVMTQLLKVQVARLATREDSFDDIWREESTAENLADITLCQSGVAGQRSHIERVPWITFSYQPWARASALINGTLGCSRETLEFGGTISCTSPPHLFFFASTVRLIKSLGTTGFSPTHSLRE
jgi:hypothetical protein